MEADDYEFLGPASVVVYCSTFKQGGSKEVLQLINYPGIPMSFQIAGTNI
jgi:hypothetical protein